MQRLRSTAVLARLVLAWFVLSVGAAMASPLVHPGSFQLVCGAGSVKLLAQQDDGDAAPAALTLDCALCTPAMVPPPAEFGLALPARASAAPMAPARLAVGRLELPQTIARGPPGRALG